MEVGLVGKPNVGKSTLFNALTMLDAAVAPYPFTTIKPNRGQTYVRALCPHVEKGVQCDPGNAGCVDGVRTLPVTMVDVAGLVPGAHEGKGLGNQFLDDLRAVNGFLQVVDLSGSTTPEGQLAEPHSQDPMIEVNFLREELTLWVKEILNRQWDRSVRGVELQGEKVETLISERLTGLSITLQDVQAALRASSADHAHPSRWTEEEKVSLSATLLRLSKPTLIVANKLDRSRAEDLARLRTEAHGVPVEGASAEIELTLRKAAKAGLIGYRSGEKQFTVRDQGKLSPRQKEALEGISRFLSLWNSTGVIESLEKLVFGGLHQMVIYPVEDEGKWTDGKGRVLPDAFLVPEGTTARQLAYRVHSDLGEGFVRGIDGRTHRAMGADHQLLNGQVVRIVSRK